MKRKLSLLLICSLCVTLLIPYSALAAGRATVTNETIFVRPFLGYYAAEVYAEVTNTGDKPIVFNGGLIELYNPDGDGIESTNVYSCYPSILAPGESGYLYETITVKDAEEKNYIDDYMLTITGKAENEKETIRLVSEGSHGEYQRSKYSTAYGLFAMVTNDTDELVRGIRVVFALYDANDTLLYATSVEPYYVGLPQGQTIEVRTDVDSRIVEAWAEEGLSPSRIVTIAFIEK